MTIISVFACLFNRYTATTTWDELVKHYSTRMFPRRQVNTNTQTWVP